MDDITKYSDIGTINRHQKYGGMVCVLLDGAQRVFAPATMWLDALREEIILNQEQYNAAYQLCRDYIVGVAMSCKSIMDYDSCGGLDCAENEKKEEARKCFNHAIKYNPSFLVISALAEAIDHIDAIVRINKYKAQKEKYQAICDRLIKYYAQFSRDDIIKHIK